MDALTRDIFISCRYDGTGDNFAARLANDLEGFGYSVYFDPNEAYTQDFPSHIQDAIRDCQDFILILSAECIDRLIANEPVDWVREEILAAKQYGKTIVPILLERATLPKDETAFPEKLRFLLHISAIKFPLNYVVSPLTVLLNKLQAKQGGKPVCNDSFSSNALYNVREDYSARLSAASAGDVEAMYDIGMMSFYGITNSDGDKACWNFDQAAHWLKKVMAADHPLSDHARSTLARMYYQGTVPREPQSYQKAFEYDCIAARTDILSAANKGFMLRYGIGSDYSYQAVLDYYDQDSHHADNASILTLAKFYAKYGKFQKAYDLYDSIDPPTPEASYQIGLLHRDGVLRDPPKPDFKTAGYYFQDAANDGHTEAAYEYGILCLFGSGNFRKDFVKAEKYFKMAADADHAQSQYMLGYMYRCGLVKKDLSLAIAYHEKARKQNHPISALELASLYQQPECQDFQKAFECAQMAAACGQAEGELILGNLLFLGRGCEADMDKAYEMYTLAYEHGIFYASVMLKKLDKLQSND